MLQEFQLRSCSTRTNVVRFLSGTWFVGVPLILAPTKKRFGGGGFEHSLRLFICFIFAPCWKDSQIYHRVFFEWFKHQRIEQVALLSQGNRHECHVSKNDLPSQANTQDTCFALWEYQLWDWFDAAREICYPIIETYLILSRLFLPLKPRKLPRFPAGNRMITCMLEIFLSRNLKRIARDLGEKLTDEELRGMIDVAWWVEMIVFFPHGIGVRTVGNSGVGWYRVI